MNKKVDLVFFVEHKDRELEPIKLIASKLRSEHGLSSAILSIGFHMHHALKIKPKAFILPYLFSRKNWPASLLIRKKNPTHFVNLNWEQLLCNANLAYKKPRDEFSKSNVYHLCWNSEFAEKLLSFGVAEAKIKITGNPARDILQHFCLKNGRDLRKTIADRFSLDDKKKWVFIPENYSWAFLTDLEIKKRINAGYSQDLAQGMRLYANQCIIEFLQFIHKLSTRSDYEVILRPHPGVTLQEYENVFNRHTGSVPKNLLISKELSIREWIAASDIIGSSWSTAVFDAKHAHKKCFLFTPFERPAFLDMPWFSSVPNIKSFEEFINFATNHEFIQLEDLINERGSVNRIADFIQTLTKETVRDEFFDDRNIYEKIKDFSRVIRCYLRERYGLVQGRTELDKFEPMYIQ